MSDYGNPATCPRCGAKAVFESGSQYGGGTVACPTGHWRGYHAPRPSVGDFVRLQEEGDDLKDQLLAAGLRDIAKMRQLDRRAGRVTLAIIVIVLGWAIGYWAGWWPALPF